MGRIRLHALLAALLALVCATTAVARTPVLRAVKKERLLAVSGISAGQWKSWWGTQRYGDGSVTLSSLVPTTPAETHSSLITTKRSWQDATIAVSTTTQKQLRTGGDPNVWEVGWLLFRFTDLENYYWFMLKTNGFELGKKQGSDTQIFLVTGDLPAIAVGQSRQVRVVMQGPRIRVFVDGSAVVDYTDPRPLAGGSVGLYEEDSQVRFDALSII